jgi:hypothetical protein
MKDPLKKILELTESSWDRPGVRFVVRDAFRKVLICRTMALGAEVYASEAGERVFCHTCKGKGCSSCGYRGTLNWQTEQEASLPDIPFVGFVFTMPQPFWAVFKAHRNLQHDLPALGAATIEQWAWTHYQVRLHIIVIQHTFGGELNHFPHLHIMVSAGGLKESEALWVESLEFDKKEIGALWQSAVTSYLWKAHRDELLRQSALPKEFNEIILKSLLRPWYVWMSPKMSKKQFLGYAGRYIRRPPIAQNRILSVTRDEVFFLGKDAESGEFYEVRWTPEKFVAQWSQHILDRYKHSMRYFGLLAPRTKSLTSAAVFALLGQIQPPKPPRQGWAELRLRTFPDDDDPLVDDFGNRMHWVGRLRPVRMRSNR